MESEDEPSLYEQFSNSFNKILNNYLKYNGNTKEKRLNDITEIIILSLSNYLSNSKLTVQEQRSKFKRLSEPTFLKKLIVEKERLASNQDYNTEILIKMIYQQVII